MKQIFYEYLVSYSTHENGSLKTMSLGHSLMVLEDKFDNTPKAMKELASTLEDKIDRNTAIVHIMSVRYKRRYTQREHTDRKFRWPWAT